jgi:hypothetical protein
MGITMLISPHELKLSLMLNDCEYLSDIIPDHGWMDGWMDG